MKKTRKHIIQTISNKAFSSIVPDEWAARELDQDYGLDFMLEIFENEESTGKIFFVQLKGTDDEPVNDSISYQIKRSHLEYYSSIPTPILFIIYSVPANMFWGVWSNNLESYLEKKKEKQKTNILRLTKEQAIIKSYFTELPKYFSIDLPNKIKISSIIDSEISELYNSKLVDWIKHYFPNTIVDDSSLLTQKIILNYKTVNNTDLNINIEFSISSTCTEIQNVDQNKFIYLPITNFNKLDIILAKPLTQLSIILSDSELEGAVLLLIKCIQVESKLLFPSENILSIGTKIIRKGNIQLFQNFIDALISNSYYYEFQLLNLLLLSSEENKFAEYYQRNLENVIPEISKQDFKGILCYNLANSYRVSNECHLASKYYQFARKYEPEYLKKSYWWYEYAGVLFQANHHKFAEYFYKKSEELGVESIRGYFVWAAIGDCLFLQCKFEEAKLFYHTYMEKHNSMPDEIFLKYDVCRNMILAGFDGVQLDINESNKLTEKAISEKNKEMLEEAISKNPLNGLAWFNYGVSLDEESKPKLSFMAYLTACSIQDWDLEAWKNCFIISWNLKNTDKILVFYEIILRRFGLESVNYLSEHVLDDPNLSHKQKLGVINGFKQIAEKLNKST